MRPFRERQASRFPADMLERLELFGRAEFGSRTSGIDFSDLYQRCLAPFWEDSQADTDGFLTDLRALTVGDEGGFVTYGAARMVWEFYGERSVSIAAALPIVDAGIDFKVARYLPGAMFSVYEYQRLVDRRKGTA